MTRPFIVMADLDGPFCTQRAQNGTGDCYDPVACGLLADLCASTGARIVIISARRRNAGLRDDLARHGLAVHLFDDPVHWRTGHDPMGLRGNEVDDWHAANPGHDYALVDDEMGSYSPHHIQRLIHTDAHTGLSMKDLMRLRRLMGLDVTDRDIADADARMPRSTLSRMARNAIDALDQGDDDRARTLLAIIADHPLAQ